MQESKFSKLHSNVASKCDQGTVESITENDKTENDHQSHELKQCIKLQKYLMKVLISN